MTTTTISYRGDLRCAVTHESGYEITTDAPADNHGKGQSFSPTDLIGTALASCIITTMAIVARQKYQLDLGKADARVDKTMAADLPRRIGAIRVDLRFAMAADHPHRADLEQIIEKCPVHHSLHPAIAVTITTAWGADL